MAKKAVASKAKKHLVIVESPAKAKTLKKFLGNHYKIEASMGHIRDLPKSQLGIDVENDFEPRYITIRGKGELLAKLRKEVKEADKVYLATDPDREGEAISWHLMHALNLDESTTQRITFNEITKSAVTKSIKDARAIAMNLVDAQQARRALDRVVGYKIGPLLWKKVKRGLSAGRVQSVALKIICDRDEEIENFLPEEYWTIDATLQTKAKELFEAKFYGTDENKIELKNKAETDKILESVKKGNFTVDEVKKGTRIKKPLPPFTTSTLQQEASKALGYATNKTMMIAQQLYEGVDIKGMGTLGLVSYIRTDSMRISDEAFSEATQYIGTTYGEQYCVGEKPVHKTRARTQDAHEAIRPTDVSLTPDAVKESLSKEQFKLYSLIWERFMASNMAPAVFDTVSVKLSCNGCGFRSSGSIMRFDGYRRLYKKDVDDQIEQNIMPDLTEGEKLTLAEIKGEQHFTQPPAHFTEAALVKALEENGVGRPSTYAPTITTIVARGYVTKDNKMLYKTELGEIVNDIMKNNFDDIVDIDFTANMEQDLDRVEDGEIPWKEILRQFYPSFKEKMELAEEKIGQIEIKDEETDVKCELCGRNMVIKFGRFGKFLACPGFPECKNAKPFFEEAGVKCPLCSGSVLIKKTKKGRKYFGCDNNPECPFMSWSRPTGDKCPICGEPLVEKGGKNKKICCANNQCGYFCEK